MKIIRFERDGQPAHGILEGDAVFELVGDLLDTPARGARLCDVGQVRLLAPVVPQTIVCMAANYAKGLIACGRKVPIEPEMFFKPPSALVGDRANIVWPAATQEIGFGSELAVVIKRPATRVPESRALDYVLGYSCTTDVMAMDLGAKDRFPTRAKGFFTFLPMGPCLVTDVDGQNLRITYRLNGRTICDDSTSSMIFGVKQVISYVSNFMTLQPLDVISMGSVVGEVTLDAGDVIEVEIEGIGTLTNAVVKE